MENWKLKIGSLAFLGLLGAAGWSEGGEPPKAEALPDVQSIVAEHEKAVVRIVTYEDYVMGLARRSGRLLWPFPFHEKIGDAFSLAFYVPTLILYPLRKSLGSGVIIDDKGHILTNAHVVHNADEFTVYLVDAKDVRRKFDAKVLGRDPHIDVAMLKIDPGKVPLVPAPLGDSDTLRRGDWVVIIGNPLNLTGSVSFGIVSGLHRQVAKFLVEDLIQLDATLNPGNSGGPVLNSRGEVIGLVSLGFSMNNGLGFAVPTSLIAPWLGDFEKGERPHRGYLGLAVRDVTPELAKKENLDVEAGVWVREVSPFSPAGAAGFEDGDVITAIDGHPVAKARDFQMAVLRTKPGASVTCKVRRKGKEVEIKADARERRTPFQVF